MNRNIFLGSMALSLALPLSLMADDRTVTGQVVDAATGLPVSGAIVRAAGLERYSTLTDDGGLYTLKVPDYVSSIQVSGPDHNLSVIGLSAGSEQRVVRLLSNVFEADYTKEINLLNNPTSTISQYSSSVNLKDDVQQQLGAFTYINTRSGNPGIGSVMFVQGLNSLNANAQPLVVIDGVILDQQYDRDVLHEGFFNDILSGINPADIESIEVMRNGTALYGARGANGVICISTRRAKSMTTRITARVSAGVTMEPNYIDVMDAEQYRGYASELLKGVDTRITNFKFLNADPTYYYYKQYHNNVDWKKDIYRTALTQNYGISVEGGDAQAKYNLSIGYTNNESVLECNDMNRLNLRFNTDIEFFKNFFVRFDASFSNTNRDIRNDGAPIQYNEGTPTAPSFLAYAKAPFLSPYAYGNGQLSDSYLEVNDETYLDEALASYDNYNYKLANPLALNEYAEAENKNHFENSLLNLAATLSYEFSKGIKLSEHFSYSLVNTNNKYYIPINGVPSYYVSSVSATRENEVRSLASKQNSIQSDTRLSWKKRYQAHDVNLFGGVRLNTEQYTRNSQLGYNTGSDKTPFMTPSLLNAKSEGANDSWRNLDFYAQGNYSYLGRYFAQANLTASGSSRFGVDASGLKVLGAVWGIFPSIQGAWLLTNEPWLADVSWVDHLRLTAGFDVSGNDGIDNYAARSFFAAQMYLNAVSGLSFAGIGNTEIKWETTRRANIGLDGNFVGNRIHAGVNFYRSTTTDLLSLQTLGFLTGMESNWTNEGKLENKGLDVALSGKIIAGRDWAWTLGLSVGHYENRIKSLAQGAQFINTDIYGGTVRTQVGSAANLFYGYRTKGVFATSEEAKSAGLYTLAANGVDRHYFGAGDMIFEDISATNASGANAPGQIDEADRVVIGNPNPDIFGNIFSSASWRGFRLDVNFNYSLGNDVYNYMRSQLESGSRFMNQTTALTQRWQAEGQVTSVPKATFQDPMGNGRFSDRWIEDGSYFRLKSVTLSYNLPIQSQFIQGIQVWVEGTNLFTATRYLGSDPEFAACNSVLGQGIDLGRVGQSRGFVAGIKLNL